MTITQKKKLFKFIMESSFQFRIEGTKQAVSKTGFSINNLENIDYLHFWGRQLYSIPEEISLLPKLHTLILTKNNLTRLPNNLDKLVTLETLDISDNNFSEFPEIIFNMPNLKYIKLDNNHLTYLPEEIVNYNIRDIHLSSWVEGNKFIEPPTEVIVNGISAIKEYFEELDKGKKKLNELKVLIVGEGGAGKTSLVNRLIYGTYNKSQKQTDGIKIDTNTFLNKNTGDSIKANYWDFGGQEIMHSTHQFFLSQRSFYILLLDGRKDERAEEWLKMIQNFGGNSEIFIIINKIDENHSASVNEKLLKRKYTNIKGVYKISCEKDIGITELKEDLENELSNLTIVNEFIPQSWFNIKSTLEKRNTDYITHSSFENICITHGIANSKKQQYLIEFLNDLGVVVHFSDLCLSSLFIINPIWATEGVYKIINSKELADNKGSLNVLELNKILDLKKYPRETHNYIIELMKKFELCYSINENNNILIPELLTKEEPDFEIPKYSMIKFRIEYDYLPKGVISRFIVKEHNQIKDSYVWRSGVVLKCITNDTYATVIADEEEKYININVFGKYPRDFLGEIRTKFKEINEKFKKNTISEKIILDEEEKYSVKLSHLYNLKNRGHEIYISEDTDEEYPIEILLEGIKQLEKDIDMPKITFNGTVNMGDNSIIGDYGNINITNEKYDDVMIKLIDDISKSQVINKQEILDNINNNKNDKSKMIPYLKELVTYGGSLGSIVGVALSIFE